MADLRLGLLTATPDLVAAGLLPSLVERLAANGLRPVAAMPRVYTSAETFMLYDGKPTHPRSDRSRLHSNWLAPRLFTGGVSLVLLLRSDAPRGDAQMALCAIKGGSGYRQALEMQLRAISASCDRCLSLVHCPDDAVGVAHELRLLFGDSLADWTTSSAALNRPTLPIEWLPNLVPSQAEEIARTGVLEAWPELLRRGVCLLAADPLSGVDTELAASLGVGFDSSRAMATRAEGEAVAPTLWRSLALLKPLLEQLHQQCVRALNVPVDPRGFARAAARATLSRILLAACSDRPVDPTLSASLVSALASVGSPPSYWEEQRLHVAAAYHAG